MPPFRVSLVILLSWICANAFLFYAEVLPRWRAGQPPLFTIDLADEAGNVRPYVQWKVLVRNEEFLKLTTGIDLVEGKEDEFILWADYKPPNPLKQKKDFLWLKHLRSEFKVHRDGDLLAAYARVSIESFRGVQIPLTMEMDGEIKNRLFHPVLTTDTLAGQKTIPLSPMQVPVNGGMFQPFHPVHRIMGLFPGRTWVQPSFDPLAMALSTSLAGLDGQEPVGTVLAKVRAGLESVNWKGKSFACQVIEFNGHEMEALVWVDVVHGAVLRQKVKFSGAFEWELVRID